MTAPMRDIVEILLLKRRPSASSASRKAPPERGNDLLAAYGEVDAILFPLDSAKARRRRLELP